MRHHVSEGARVRTIEFDLVYTLLLSIAALFVGRFLVARVAADAKPPGTSRGKGG